MDQIHRGELFLSQFRVNMVVFMCGAAAGLQQFGNHRCAFGILDGYSLLNRAWKRLLNQKAGSRVFVESSKLMPCVRLFSEDLAKHTPDLRRLLTLLTSLSFALM